MVSTSASPSLPPSLLLSVADSVVQVFQSLITILTDFYEASLSSRDGPSFTTCMLTTEVVQLTCNDLLQKLAVLWPCEKQFVAVLGRTGCGKSTLLNLLLSMMCTSGDRYLVGIRADKSRAVLRDTARFYGVPTTSCKNGMNQLQAEDATEGLEVYPNESHPADNDIPDDVWHGEKLSVQGMLGICCAQERSVYMSNHIPQYDTHPFILQNGRMGDAGTTKVTSIEYGPKYAGHIRWMTRKKVRKNLRDLRQKLDSSEQRSAMDVRTLAELKEFWCFVRQLVRLPSSAEKPTEEQINMVIDDLGTNRNLLGKEEVIETSTTKGCTKDRVFVREGIRKKLQQQLGKLIEDLSIKVPIASFEGGLSLLDVPGTNDPRVLHQRETRDAIYRTSLILLVLDKSVIDVQTQESLAESILLERMLTDEAVRCSLVAVGIAEKETKRGQAPKDLIAGFDPKEIILKTLRKVFLTIASRLCKSKRLEQKNALQRIDSLFKSSIVLIPVLPFLCASLHLSPSNGELHQTTCQAEVKNQCPLLMSNDEVRERCLETNIPWLLEKLHSVRVPPSKEELQEFMSSTIESLKLLTKQYMLDDSFSKYIKQEHDQAVGIAAESVKVESHLAVNTQILFDMLDQCAKDCSLEPNNIEDVCNSLGQDVLSKLQSGQFLFGPSLLRGFCPEAIGQKASNLTLLVDKESKYFIDIAFNYLRSQRVDATQLIALQEKDCLVFALGLHTQLQKKWELSLHRLRAKCFCGGDDGGLLGQVRAALRKAYYGTLKYLLKVLRQGSKSRSFGEMLRPVLESNELGLYAARLAKPEVEKAVKTFWENLVESTNAEMQFLWRAWRAEVGDLAKSTAEMVRIQKEVMKDTDTVNKMRRGGERLRSFQETLKGKIEELESLKGILHESSCQAKEVSEYGYGLLQSDAVLFTEEGRNIERSAGISENEGRHASRQGGECAVECALPPHVILEKNSHFSDDYQAGKESVKPSINSRLGFAKEDAGRADLSTQRGDRVGQLICPIHLLAESADDSHDHARKQIMHPDVTDANISPRKLSGSISRLGSFSGKPSRKAQILSEAESHKLQKRDSNASRSRK